MNITKEQMLQTLEETDRDLANWPDPMGWLAEKRKVLRAIRALIESSGERESGGEKTAENCRHANPFDGCGMAHGDCSPKECPHWGSKSAPSSGEGIKPDPAPSPGPSADRVVAYYEAARNWFCDFYYWATHDMQGNPAHTEMNDGMFRAVYGAICSKRDEKPAPLPKEVE